MKYNEIIKLNNELEKKVNSAQYSIAIISNIMVHQSEEICEYFLRVDSINAKVLLGEYDNIVQGSIKFKDANAVIIFWEACNFIDGFHYKVESFSNSEFESIIEKIKIEINLVISNLEDTSLVLINRFSSLIFNQFSLSNNRINQLVERLNIFLEDRCSANFEIIDIDKVISRLSIKSSTDLRYYYSSKTLYSIDFYKKYFEYIKPIFLSKTGKIKKALIFDCDNTLWKGVLGEEGFENIKIYKEVQYLALQLAKKGVIICICSKNNPEDVDNVLENHPDMILRDKDIVIKKVNWNDKVSNLISIAQDLNIGLDSLVFLDDSSFEVGLIKHNLPSVKAFQVPSQEYKYGLLMRKVSNLFYIASQTKEDVQKVQFYKDQLQRDKERGNIENIEDYLKSLDLVLVVHIDDLNQVSRIAQMTQKTNQFNLTTKRYTESDIKKLVEDGSKTVISISVSDRYGDSGITGLSILDNSKSVVDTLLLSCRILGRNIEYKFMDIIVNFAKNKDVRVLNSQFIKTTKNQQVSDFYEKCGFSKIGEVDDSVQYNIRIDGYKSKGIKYIKVINGK
jgi:FkbH-like protein